MKRIIYKYDENFVNEVLNDKNRCRKDKVDTLLHINAILYSNLGTDSTSQEKEIAKKRSIDIFRKIKTLDKKLGDELLYSENLKK